ncbi:unnamed protein product, partial [Meganyctiphanes norvegica]
ESQRYAVEDDACQYLNDDGQVDGPYMRCWCPDHLCNSYLCEECFTVPPNTDTPTTTTYIPNSTQEPPSKGNENIIRTGSYVAHPGGHCYLVGSVTYCHCTSSFCNGVNVAHTSTD